LTGKTMGNMEEIIATNIMDYHNTDIYPEFSIEKFCYYLLSPSFIEKYRTMKNVYPYIPSVYTDQIAMAIYEYQLENEQPLIDLLSKIK
jgi:hypothetical protein